MAVTPPDPLRELILRIRAGDEAAWTEFIDRFAPLLLQAARIVERDRDAASDAFVFACERLRERRGARLSTFDFDRPGTFQTWLRAVAINLARDARRQRQGRFRPFAMSRRFPPLERRVFRLRYELGLTFDQILASLTPEFPGLTETRLAQADATVATYVSSRQRWVLLTRRPRVDSLDANTEQDSGAPPELTSDGPDPEWQAIQHQSGELLNRALSQLTPRDRLLVRLHFERGLTLATLARMFDLPNPQSVHRRLQTILVRLRTSIGEAR